VGISEKAHRVKGCEKALLYVLVDDFSERADHAVLWHTFHSILDKVDLDNAVGRRVIL
jgi:hypothetical protein